MKENIKYFESLNDANGYIINDIPFTSYIKEKGLVLFNNEPNKMIIILNNKAIVNEAVNIVFDTLNDADGYVIEEVPFSCYIKLNQQFLECNLENKMLIIEDGLIIIHDVVNMVFETLNDADGYIIETIPFSCYIKENHLLLECNLENCKIVIENRVAVIKERDDNIIRYTATRKVTPSNPGSLPTIISNDFDQNTGNGIIKFATVVSSIGYLAFLRCTSLTSVTIPNSVTSIGTAAFVHCTGLTSVTIPNNVTSIGSAFHGCSSLTSINVASDNPNYCSVNGVLFNKNKRMLISYPGGKQGPYSIPNSIENIGDYAFTYCSGLTSIEIPDSVINFGRSAFADCTSLTSVSIPNSVQNIGSFVFSGCSSLLSVTIPNSVTSIGERAFYNCTGLTSISYTGTISQYNSITKGTNWHSNVPTTQVYCLGENPPAYTPI